MEELYYAMHYHTLPLPLKPRAFSTALAAF